MSEPHQNRKLDGFTRVAEWYFANSPATWCISRHPSGWYVTAADGTFVSAHRTKRDAAANLTDGPCARAHYAALDWYLGYSRDARLRPPTPAERDAVARVLSSMPLPLRSDGWNRDKTARVVNNPMAQYDW